MNKNSSLNQKIKQLYLDWISQSSYEFLIHEHVNYYPKQRSWIIFEDSIYQQQKSTINAFKFKAHQIEPADHEDITFLKFLNKADFFSHQKDWFEEHLIMNEETEKLIIEDLFNYIVKNLDGNEQLEYISISPRIFSYPCLFSFFANNKNIFKQFLQSPAKRYISTMSNEEFDKFLKTFENVFGGNKDKETLLFNFLSLRQNKLLKKIETQNTLKTYLDQNIDETNQEMFSIFVEKTEDQEFFNPNIETIGITIDKNGIYNCINKPGMLIDKKLIYSLIENFIFYIRKNDFEKNRLGIEDIQMQNHEPKLSWYSIVVTKHKNKLPTLNYHELVKFCLTNSNDFFETIRKSEYEFQKQISYFLMDNKLDTKPNNPDKSTKKI